VTQAIFQGDCRWCSKVTDPLAQARVIVQEVADEHRIPVDDVYSRDQRAYIVAARACAMRRIRNELGLKLMAIGDIFGLDHSTVIYHLNSGRGARDRTSLRGEH